MSQQESRNNSSWTRQFCLIYTRNIKRLYREKVSLLMQVVWPLAVFAAFFVLRLAFVQVEKPACYSKPVALPSAGTIPFVQSMVCGLSMQCFDHPVDDPFIFYNRAAIPRLWEELQPVFRNKTRMDALGEFVRGMKIFADAFQRFRNNATVRFDTSKIFYDLGAMAAQAIGIPLPTNRLKRSELPNLNKTHDWDHENTDMVTKIRRSVNGNEASWSNNLFPLALRVMETGLGSFFNIGGTADNSLMIRVLPQIFKTYLAKLTKAGLFASREEINEQLSRWHTSQDALQTIFSATSDAIKKIYAFETSGKYAAGDRSDRTLHLLNLAGESMCGHSIMDAKEMKTIQQSKTTTYKNREEAMELDKADDTEHKSTDFMRHSLASSKKTMNDLSVLFEDLGFAAHAASSRGMQRLVQQLDARDRQRRQQMSVFEQHHIPVSGKKILQPDPSIEPSICNRLRAQLENSLYGNIALTHMKPFTHGRIVYTIQSFGDKEFEHFAERIINQTSAAFEEIAVTFLNIEMIGNIGAAVVDLWQQRLNNDDEGTFTWVMERFVETDELQNLLESPSAGTFLSAAWQLARVLFFSSTELNDQLVELVRSGLDIVAESIQKCSSRSSHLERAQNETALENRARKLELTHELFGAVVLSKPFDVNERERTADGWDDHLHDDANARIRYKIRLDKDRVRDTGAVDQFFDPPGPFVNAVDDLRYYFGFIPLQDILERAILTQVDAQQHGAKLHAVYQVAKVDVEQATASTTAKSKLKTIVAYDDYQYDEATGDGAFHPNATIMRAVPDTSSTVDSTKPSSQRFPAMFAEQFPYPCFEQDDFRVVELIFLPIMAMLAWSYAIGTFARHLVSDREHGYDVLMRLYGLKPGVLSCAWFGTVVSVGFVICIPMTLVCKYGQLLSHIDGILLFVIMFQSFWTMMCLNYFITAFTSKGSSAAALGLVINVACGLPAIYVIMREIRYFDVRYLKMLCLAPNTAVVLFITYAIRFEQDGIGLNWDNADWSPILFDAFSAWSALKILIFDSVLFICLGVCFRCLISLRNENRAVQKLSSLLQPFSSLRACCKWDTNQGNKTNVKLLATKTIREDTVYGASATSFTNGLVSIDNPDEDSLRTRTPGLANQTGDSFILNSCYEQPSSDFGINVQNLTVVYPTSLFRPNISLEKRTAVRNISLIMRKNEITCLLGPNGAGKSSTISVICGVRQASSGAVYIAGHDIIRNRHAAQSLLGYCPQKDVLFDWLTIREHIELYSKLRGSSGFALDCDVEQMLSGMGLRRYADWYPQQLSGGYRRRCMMAIAFSCQSRVVVLDEPTSGVDPSARCHLWHLIMTQKQGRTILLTTHHLDEADYLADKVAILVQGQVKAFGTAAELRTVCSSSPGSSIVPAVEGIDKLPQLIFLKIVKAKQQVGDLSASRLHAFICSRLSGTTKVYENPQTVIYLINRSGLKQYTDNEIDSDTISFMTELEQKQTYYGVADVFFELPKLDVVYAVITGGEDALNSEEGRPVCWKLPELTGGDNSNATATNAELAKETNSSAKDVGSVIRFSEQPELNHKPEPNFTGNSTEQSGGPSNGFAHQTISSSKWRDFYGNSPVFRSQSWRKIKTLCRKRFLHLFRDLKSTLALLMAPILLIMLALSLAKDRPPATNSRPMDLNPFYMYWIHPLFFAYNLTDTKPIIKNEANIGASQLMHTMLSSHRQLTGHLPRSWGRRFFMNPNMEERQLRRFKQSVVLRETYDGEQHMSAFSSASNDTCAASNDKSYVGIWTAFERHRQRMFHLFENVSDVYGQESSRYILPRNRLDRHIFGGFTIGTSVAPLQNSSFNYSPYVRVWHNIRGRHALPAYLSYINSVMLKSMNLYHGLPTNKASPDYGWKTNGQKYIQSFENRLIEHAFDNVPHPHNSGANNSLHNWYKNAVRIAGYNHPLPLTEAQQNEYTDVQNSGDVGVTLLILEALSIVPCALIIYVVREKSTGERRLQYLAGVTPLIYWLSAFICDMLIYFGITVCCAILFSLYQIPIFWDQYNFKAMLALIFGYGWSAMPLMYVASHAFKDGAMAFVTLFCFNTLTSIVYMALASPAGIFFWMASTKTFVPKGPIFDIFPGFLFGNGSTTTFPASQVLDMIKTKLESYMMHKYLCVVMSEQNAEVNANQSSSLNEHNIQPKQDDLCRSSPYPYPFEWDILGRLLFLMFVVGIAFFVINLTLEYLFVVIPQWRGSIRSSGLVKSSGKRLRKNNGRRRLSMNYENQVSRTPHDTATGPHYPGYVTEDDLLDWDNDVDDEMETNLQGRTGPTKTDSLDDISQLPINDKNWKGAMTGAELRELDVQEPLIEVRNTWYSYSSKTTQLYHWIIRLCSKRNHLLTQDYQDHSTKYAIRGTTLSFLPGQCYGLLGFNGSGKSTLFKMLSGDLSATYGCLQFNFNWKKPNTIGYCPQFDALDRYCTVREMLEIYATLKGLNYPSVEADDCMRRLQLSQFENKLTKDLSGGNQRKLSAAIAFLGDPNIVLLDEATSGMDLRARGCMGEFVNEYLAKSGSGDKRRAVVLTSHKMGEAAMLCSRLTILADGQVKCEGSPDEIRERYGAGLYVLLVRFVADKSMNATSLSTSTTCVEFGRIHIKNALEKIGFTARVQRDGNNILEFLVRAAAVTGEAKDVSVHQSSRGGVKNTEQHYNNPHKCTSAELAITNTPNCSESFRECTGSFRLYHALEALRKPLHISEYELRRATLSEVFSCIAMARRKSTITPMSPYSTNQYLGSSGEKNL